MDDRSLDDYVEFSAKALIGNEVKNLGGCALVSIAECECGVFWAGAVEESFPLGEGSQARFGRRMMEENVERMHAAAVSSETGPRRGATQGLMPIYDDGVRDELPELQEVVFARAAEWTGASRDELWAAVSAYERRLVGGQGI